MGCAVSADGTHTSTATGGRIDEASEKRDGKKGPDAANGEATVAATPQQQLQDDNQQSTAVTAIKAPAESGPPPPAPTPPANVIPATIAGYPVNTYTDGTTRVAVKCVILSRQKCESVCRFLDSVRKARDRNNGLFRNPEEHIEAEPRRDFDTASAASGRSKVEPSMSAAYPNSSVVGHGMNVSMAVHVGQSEALSPSPHGGLPNAPEASNTPGRAANHRSGHERSGHAAPQGAAQPAPSGAADGGPAPAPNVGADKHASAQPQGQVAPSSQPPAGDKAAVQATDAQGSSQRKQQEGGEPIPGSVDVDGAL